MRLISYYDERQSNMEIYTNSSDQITIEIKHYSDIQNESKLVSLDLDDVKRLIEDLKDLVENVGLD